MVGAPQHRPVHQNRARRKEKEHRNPVGPLAPPAPKPEKTRRQHAQERRNPRPGQVERCLDIVAKPTQHARERGGQIVKRGRRVRLGSLGPVLKLVPRNDRAGVLINALHARHPGITVRVHKERPARHEHLRAVPAPECHRHNKQRRQHAQRAEPFPGREAQHHPRNVPEAGKSVHLGVFWDELATYCIRRDRRPQ